jgi:Rieske 2Fe-2S family protein
MTIDTKELPSIDAELQESLPAHYYLSDDVFSREKEAMFFREWFCAGREEQLPKPGDYLVVNVVGESILVVRDLDGRLRAHYNVCRHRGCQLALPATTQGIEEGMAGWSGHFNRAIRCPYHSWVYGFDGSLRGAPFLRESEGFRKEDLSLYSVGIDTWGGFFFLNLTPETVGTLHDQLKKAMTVFARFPLRDLRTARRITYEVDANWKLVMENYNECYHCAGVHPELCTIVPVFKQKGGSDLDFGAGIRQREGTSTYTFSGTSSRAPFPGLTSDEVSLHWGNISYPNMMTSVSSDHVAAFTLWSRSPGHTTVTCDFLFHPLEMARSDFDPSDVVDF